jgi:hypothetical protein
MYIRLTLTGVFDEQFGPGNPATYGPELLWPVWGIALGAAAAITVADFSKDGMCPPFASLKFSL